MFQHEVINRMIPAFHGRVRHVFGPPTGKGASGHSGSRGEAPHSVLFTTAPVSPVTSPGDAETAPVLDGTVASTSTTGVHCAAPACGPESCRPSSVRRPAPLDSTNSIWG